MVSGVPDNAATVAPFVKLNSTEEAPEVVPAPIEIVTDEVLNHTGKVANTPELGVSPTLAMNVELIKFVPNTVMVLPT